MWDSQYLLARMQWVRGRGVEMKMERESDPWGYDEGFQFDSFESKGNRSLWKILNRNKMWSASGY